MTIKQVLGRMGYLVLRNGKVEIKGQNKPEFKDLPNLSHEWSQHFDLGSAFSKPDYFLPFAAAEGLTSAEQIQSKGIMVHALNSRLIYPLYGVWSPTSQEYLSLLSNYVEQTKTQYVGMQNCVDLGCGTGILPIIMSENAGYEGHVFSVDNLSYACEAAKMNSQIFGLGTRQTSIEFDLTEMYYKTKPTTDQRAELIFYKKITQDLGLPLQTDLILCNPPWLPCSKVPREISPLDNGVFDPEN